MTTTSDGETNEGIPVKCPACTLERNIASQDPKHFRGHDLMAYTSPEEKRIGRDAALAPTIEDEKQADPGGKDDPGPDKPLEDPHRHEESGEESQKEQTRNPASLQEKDLAWQPSHAPGGVWLHKVPRSDTYFLFLLAAAVPSSPWGVEGDPSVWFPDHTVSVFFGS
ncbi:hypothetical protein NDU88_005946 [Pleurodeles waltl]|uniref:Uncharacterized protein n=1 Tax=Pleurodeles waltl TaxID=8319 RepID=A0AAV7NQE9_PLEWA|nr:hypothetical protein NDU88_005946 [Pleurodeles waltl]